jgi:hypothetical protein
MQIRKKQLEKETQSLDANKPKQRDLQVRSRQSSRLAKTLRTEQILS